MKKTFIILLFTLLNISTQAQNSTKICSIGFVSADSVEIVFTKPTDSLLINQIDNYQLFIKNDPQNNWSYRQSLNKDSLSVFYDTLSNANDSNYYKVYAFDNLGQIIDSSNSASYIHFNTIVDTAMSKVDFFVCPPLGIQCSQFYILKDSSGIKDTLLSLAPNTSCISFVQFYGSGIHANFYITGKLINSCYPNYKINSGISISSNIRSVSIPFPPTTPTLLAYYPLNGNVNDSIGINDGVLHGCTWTTDSAGNSNSALQFNGTSDWVQFFSAPITNNQSFTISAWVKLDNQKDNNPIVDFGYNGNFNPNEISFGTYKFNTTQSVLYTGNYYTNNSNLRRVEQSPAYLPSVGKHIETSNWYNVILVYDNTNSPWNNPSNFGSLEDSYKFYINGVQLSKPSTPSTWNNNPFSSNSTFPLINTMAMGISKGEGNTQYFSGLIDEVKIYSGALDSNAIQNLYLSTYTGIEDLYLSTITAYPNPAINTIKFSENKIFNFIQIYDLSGKIILNKLNTNLIDISNLNPGIYIAKLKLKGLEYQTKIIKE